MGQILRFLIPVSRQETSAWWAAIGTPGTPRRVDHGVLYEGPPDDSGDYWKKIDMPDDVASGVVRNTIPHSTMGELIVGNYDLKGPRLR